MQTKLGGRHRTYLVVSLVANLGLLGVFKYYGFFSAQLAALLQTLGVYTSLPVLDVILPVGISFYTFQTLSYTIDVYRGSHGTHPEFHGFRAIRRLFPAARRRPDRAFNEFVAADAQSAPV